MGSVVGEARQVLSRTGPGAYSTQFQGLRQLTGPTKGVAGALWAALAWATDRIDEYADLEAAREANGVTNVLNELVEDRLLEVGRSSRDFDLTIIELPLTEPRAWYLEPSTIFMSHRLLSQPDVFRSYVQPVVELLA